jgi:hypothetical protein
MSAHRSPVGPSRRVARLITALPLAAALAAALACGDRADPVAPRGARPLAPDTARAAVYPGTTNTEFSGVQVQSEGMGLSIKFNYTGAVTPSLAVGTGPDVFATQVRSVAATKQAGGYWTAHAGGLKAGQRYYYRLDNLKSTWYDSAKTLRRDLTFDLDSAYVHFDGDDGPGCGEITIRTTIGPNSFTPSWGWDILMPERCMYSGNMYRFTNAYGKESFEGYPLDDARTVINAYERDGAAFCATWTPKCGDHNNNAWGPQALFAVYQTGTQKFVQSTWWGFRPHLTFYGSLTVTYVAW